MKEVPSSCTFIPLSTAQFYHTNFLPNEQIMEKGWKQFLSYISQHCRNSTRHAIITTSKNNLTFVTFYQYLLQNYVCVVRYLRQNVMRRIIANGSTLQGGCCHRHRAVLDKDKWRIVAWPVCPEFFLRTYVNPWRNPTYKGKSVKMKFSDSRWPMMIYLHKVYTLI